MAAPKRTAAIFFMKKHNSILWKFTDANSAKTSYIFGSMHISDDRVYSKVECLETLMEELSEFYCEIDLDESAGISRDSFQFSQIENLQSLYGDKAYNKMKKLFKKSFNIDLDPMKNLFPILISNRIAESILESERQIPLDSFLWKKAKEKGLILKGMEKLVDQLSVMNNISMEYQLKQLVDIRRNPKSYRRKIIKLLELYQQEKIHKIYQLTKKSLGKFRDLMLYSRNENMAKVIIGNSSVPSLYVMGAAHLGGHFGVLALLKREGIKVHPVF